MTLPRRTLTSIASLCLVTAFAATSTLFGCASGVDVAGARAIVVPPDRPARVTLRVITLDGAPISTLYARARDSGRTVDSAAVMENGTANLTLRVGLPADISIASAEPSRYYPSVGRATALADTVIDVVLIPKSWTVRRGIYLSVERPIDLRAAFATIADGSHFLAFASPTTELFTSWVPSAFPIPLSLDTTGVQRWTSADSIGFWSVVSGLDTVFGRRLFRPANRGGFVPPHGIGLRLDPPGSTYSGLLRFDSESCRLPRRLCNDVQGEVMFTSGFLYAGFSLFPDQREQERRRAVAHELMHALGFGHVCAWPSVVLITQPSCIGLPEVPSRPTAEDVAYVELVVELAGVLVDHPFAWNLGEALAALP